MRKLTTFAASVALFGAAVLPVLGASNNCGNGTTGPLSNNYCTINNTSNVSVKNVSDAQIVNNVTTTSSTGNNSASFNTLGGSITTGNATSNTTVSSVANVNTTMVTGGPAGADNSGDNTITGPLSDNRVDINNRLAVDVTNSNTATVENYVTTTADTGNNTADTNTGPGSVMTGDSYLTTTVANRVNDNWNDIDAGAGGSVSNTAVNSITGPLSLNYLDINNDAKVNVDNINDMLVGNFVRALSNTGGNSASTTTLGGDIGTGNAVGAVLVDTKGNINTTDIDLAMGGFAQMIENGTTGPDSDNRATVENTQNVDVENWNNKCRSHNADRIDGIPGYTGEYNRPGCDPEDLGVFTYNYDVVDTGNNVTDFNTGGGVLATGWTNLVKTVATYMNDTLVQIQ